MTPKCHVFKVKLFSSKNTLLARKIICEKKRCLIGYIYARGNNNNHDKENNKNISKTQLNLR